MIAIILSWVSIERPGYDTVDFVLIEIFSSLVRISGKISCLM